MSSKPDRRPPNSPERGDVEPLVAENLGLVYDAARKLARASGAGPERGDLISAGVQGLIQAATTFDPGRGHAFSTLAVTRIRGAMLDELRRWDHTPRSVRKKERQIKHAEGLLWAELKRQPTLDEIAESLEISSDELHTWYLDVSRHVEESLDRSPTKRPDEGGRLTVADVVADPTPDVVETLGREDTASILQDCIRQLPEREARVLALYYYEELRLREIADLLGVTESRVSQIRHGALKTLRSMMTERGVEP